MPLYLAFTTYGVHTYTQGADLRLCFTLATCIFLSFLTCSARVFRFHALWSQRLVQWNAVGAMVRTGGGTFMDLLLPDSLPLTILVALN
jgi:hypothetical protein